MLWVQGCGCAPVGVHLGVGVHLLGFMESGCAPVEDGDCTVESSLGNPDGDAGALLGAEDVVDHQDGHHVECIVAPARGIADPKRPIAVDAPALEGRVVLRRGATADH